jgi:hypothetical protein
MGDIGLGRVDGVERKRAENESQGQGPGAFEKRIEGSTRLCLAL